MGRELLTDAGRQSTASRFETSASGVEPGRLSEAPPAVIRANGETQSSDAALAELEEVQDKVVEGAARKSVAILEGEREDAFADAVEETADREAKVGAGRGAEVGDAVGNERLAAEVAPLDEVEAEDDRARQAHPETAAAPRTMPEVADARQQAAGPPDAGLDAAEKLPEPDAGVRAEFQADYGQPRGAGVQDSYWSAPPPPESTVTPNWSGALGCYRMQLDWETGIGLPPAEVRLTDGMAKDIAGAALYGVIGLGDVDLEDDGIGDYGWTAFGQDSVYVRWVARHGSLTMRLRALEDRLEGFGRATPDDGPEDDPSHPHGPVTMWRIPCAHEGG
jgi:hypothetical protein